MITDDESIELLRSACEKTRDKLTEFKELCNTSNSNIGSSYSNFKKLLTAGGEFDLLLNMLNKVLTDSHYEARHGNLGGGLSRDLTTALGATIIAQDLIKGLIDRGETVSATSPSSKAIWHLRQAVQIINQTRK